jgi:hypothetical protein
MASRSGQVTLRGRFSPGSLVTLTKVAGEHVLRPEGGEQIEVKTVGEEEGAPRVGYVRFSKGVEPGARYIIHGLEGGVPLEVRIRGRTKDDPAEVLEQPPVQPDRTRLSDGSWSDERPTKESAPDILAAQADLRHAPKGTQLRSDTFRGEAHPVDPDEKTPKRRQEDVPEGTPQMSDTRRREVDGVVVGGGGEAAEIIVGPQRQEDVPDRVQQRSSTPTGTAQMMPAGDSIKQALDRESSFAKETRGEPVRASAEPIDVKGAKIDHPSGATQKASEERDREIKQSERDAAVAPPATDQPADGPADTSGQDAQGQPVAEDVAAAAGVVPAKDPAVIEAQKAKRRERDRKRRAQASSSGSKKAAPRKASASKKSTRKK